ncbi:MAG: hypothetical protein ACREO7_04220 [Pseudoxanthomonas sp.]
MTQASTLAKGCWTDVAAGGAREAGARFAHALAIAKKTSSRPASGRVRRRGEGEFILFSPFRFMNGYRGTFMRWFVLRRNCNDAFGSLHATKSEACAEERPADARHD